MLFLLAAAAMVAQLVIVRFSGISQSCCFFLCGIQFYKKANVDVAVSLFSYIPVYFTLSCFCGQLAHALHGYGQLLLVRNYSSTKMLAKQILTMHIQFFGLFLFQSLLWFLLPGAGTKPSSMILFQMLIMYYFSFFALILMQFFLEFFIRPQLACLTVNFYYLVGLFIPSSIDSPQLRFFQYLFIPTYAMGYRNGLLHNFSGGATLVSFFPSLPVLLVIELSIFMLSVFKLNRTDIL